MHVTLTGNRPLPCEWLSCGHLGLLQVGVSLESCKGGVCRSAERQEALTAIAERIFGLSGRIG